VLFEDGWPLCTYSYQCGNNNEPLNKNGASESLKIILKGAKKTGVNDTEYSEKKSYL